MSEGERRPLGFAARARRLARVCSAFLVALVIASGTAACEQPVQAQPTPSPGPPSVDAAWLAPIAALVRAERYEDGLRALEAADASHRAQGAAVVLRGRLLEALGRHAEAAAAYESQLGAVPRAVSADVALRRAVALAKAERCAEASRVAGSSNAAKLAAAECYVRARDRASATTLLRALTSASGVDVWHVRALLARQLLEAGDRSEATRLTHELLVSRPDHRDADDVTRRLTSAGAAPRFTVAERLTRVDRLLDVRQPRAALEEITHITPLPRDHTVRARVLHLRGRALYATRRNYDEAATVLAEASRSGGPSAVDDAFFAARALSRTDREVRAIAAFRRFVRAHPDDAHAAEAEYLAAWTELRLGRAEGRAAMDRFLRGPRGARDASLAQDARWQLAYDALTHDHPRDAIALFDRYLQNADVGMSKARGTYWSARSRQLAGDRDEAIARYRTALSVEPLHWYALLARARLIELGIDPGPPFADTADAGAPFTRPALSVDLSVLPEVAAFYASIGLDRDASRALAEDEARVRSRAGVEGLVRAYGALGDAARPYRLVTAAYASELRRAPAGTNAWIWNAAYPLAFSTDVDRETSARALPRGYLYAIMRQESSFDVRAVSSADAIGLLQLLPSTARGIAQREGIADFDRDRLFEPRVNVQLGASYHEALLREFRGQSPLAIGAYNAGSARVKGWLRRTAACDLDLFVESIPVDQTRNYIRRVTTSWARYRYLENPSAGWPDLGLPARIDPASLTGPAFEPRIDDDD